MIALKKENRHPLRETKKGDGEKERKKDRAGDRRRKERRKRAWKYDEKESGEKKVVEDEAEEEEMVARRYAFECVLARILSSRAHRRGHKRKYM